MVRVEGACAEKELIDKFKSPALESLKLPQCFVISFTLFLPDKLYSIKPILERAELDSRQQEMGTF
jgi:hypothetical protein